MAPPDTGVINSALGVGGIALAATLVDRNLRSSPLRRPSSVTTSSQTVSPNSSAASNTLSSSAAAVSPVAVSDLGANQVDSAPLNSPHSSIAAPGSRMPASVVASPIQAQTSVRAPVPSNFESPRILPEFNTIPNGLSGVHSSPELASSAPIRAERPYTPPLLPSPTSETASAGPKSQTGGDAKSAENQNAPDSKPKVVVAKDDGIPRRANPGEIISPERALGIPSKVASSDCGGLLRAMAAAH